MANRILVVGPSAGLAEEFVASAPAGWGFEGAGRRTALFTADRYEVVHLIDARDIGPLEYSVRANDCETVVCFLQEADRTRCRQERPASGGLPAGIAWEINALAIEAVGRAAVSERKRVIVVSTDEVFPENGGPATESTPPLPWSENPSWYGGTRAEGETLLQRLPGSIAVLRVSGLFGWKTTPDCDRRLPSQLDRETGAPDVCQPTWVPDAVRALRFLVENPLSGVFHVSLREPVRCTEFREALRRRVASEPTATEVPRERHPGLVPGRLLSLGLGLATLREAVEHWPAPTLD